MPGVYSVEDLLKLRASPLICRPANLPPIEEWMGVQETTNKRPAARTKQDELSSVQSETFQKRPTVLDSQRRTTTADPERIVLGPPRRSFASANLRTSGRLQDGLEETPNKDRTSLQERSRNGEGLDFTSSDRRSTQSNGRFSSRQESADPDLENRRDYDRRPKWAGRDRTEQGVEDEQEESGRPGFRRDAHSRAKTSQSWFKKDGLEAQDEPRRDADKGQEWRRSEWGRERDWDRSGRAEAEPEWMDSAEPEEPFQVRTQEDFQRWKEKMKAGGATSQSKTDSAQSAGAPETIQAQPAKTVFSPEPDDSMDKFFARFESKTVEQKPGPAKQHGRTRFASFFSPPPEQGKQDEAPPPMPAVVRPSSASQPGSATDADQAGFARILEMLQTRSSNPTPQAQETTKTRTPLYARRADSRAESESRPSPQNLLSILAGQNGPQRQEPATAQPPANQERLAEPQPQPQSQPPAEPHTHTRQQSSINKDEVLLNLLRQASLAPKPQPPAPRQQAEGRGGAAMYAMMSESNVRIGTARGQIPSPVQLQELMMQQRREVGRATFEESPISMYQNDPTQREQVPGRPANGNRSGLSEDPLMALLRSQNPQQRSMPPPQPPQGLPPGLQRPPGLDSMVRPNPNWPPQEAPSRPPQQAHRQPPLPPGLGGNVPRGMMGAPPPSQLQQLPIQPSMPPPAPQPRPQQQQRKYTGDLGPIPAGPPSLPPGMYPPPGFMNAGPPPGFPGSMANHPAARYQGEPGPPLPGMNRAAFLDMYGDVAGGRGVGLRGGSANGGMPPYR
ncbi:hypothetical protein A1O1_09211 [Capronia coronata CBS 617.96]|uniref:Uncharacterized protein n=1 Tax=Capronia coronata CBS 617.96 TaxID=1182541 RepID=W9Y8T8_9EURO|nr:uncharacterized protein A1O1_09211 [Capronia coronata CBS 617.96]EXJ78809.1 hypothetical protein A1O1_09211 [Capronia coronata CBS 617.96]